MITATPLYAAILVVMFLVLSYHVILLRYKLNIPVGDGGNEQMQQLLQARSNLVDYVPMALLMMLMLEYLDTKPVIIHGLGVTIVLSRLIQGWGLSISAGGSIGRIVGAILMHLVMLVEVTLCLWKFVWLNDVDLLILSKLG